MKLLKLTGNSCDITGGVEHTFGLKEREWSAIFGKICVGCTKDMTFHLRQKW